MGFYAHHAVIVHASEYAWSDIAPPDLTPPDVAAFRASLPEEYRCLVVGPVPNVLGDFVFAFLPDGSKEGWNVSNRADEYRAQFKSLFSWTYSDGSSPYDVVEIRFGGDEPDDAWMKQGAGDESDA